MQWIKSRNCDIVDYGGPQLSWQNKKSRHYKLNSWQDNVIWRQNKINSWQYTINSLQNEINSRQYTINSQQNEINSRQNTPNSRQNAINSRQNTPNSLQNKVNSWQNKENELVSSWSVVVIYFSNGMSCNSNTLLARKPPFLMQCSLSWAHDVLQLLWFVSRSKCQLLQRLW